MLKDFRNDLIELHKNQKNKPLKYHGPLLTLMINDFLIWLIKSVVFYLFYPLRMESGNTFKFSNEEVKKMNYLLPKGYKFVQRDEIEKKQSQKTIKKKIIPPPVQTFTPAPQIKPRIEKVKEE